MRKALFATPILLLVTAGPLIGQQSQANPSVIITEKCANEWPNDYDMRNYCRSQQYKGLREMRQLRRRNGGVSQSAFDTMYQKCRREWPRDFQMTTYCLNQQLQGYSDVRGARSPRQVGMTRPEQRQVKRHCTSEWPDDFQMQSYCERQQQKGLRYLKSEPPYGVSSSMWNRIRTHCRGEWPQDFQMQAYCARQQIEP